MLPRDVEYHQYKGEGAFKVLAQQLVKGMSGTMPIQDFPWSIMEHHLYLLDLASRQPCEPRPFGEELRRVWGHCLILH